MFERGFTAYEYDGTIEGLLCCVFESYQKKEMPLDITPCGERQLTLGTTRFIQTDLTKAARVRRAIPRKISHDALMLFENVFLTFMEQKELYTLRFLQLGFAMGKDVMSHLTDDAVSALQKAERHLLNESHRYKQFIRFSVSGQVLVSVIKPLNQVLPIIAPHFIDRYPEEAFLIYDATHGMALVSRPGKSAIVPVDSFVLENPDEEEQMYRELWCEYYDAIAIEGRYNPKCRMSHMPKRYWDVMTEFCRSDKSKVSRQYQ